MEKKNKKRISLGMRVFILVTLLSAVFMVLFGIINYFIISSSAESITFTNTAVVIIVSILTVIVVSLLLGLCVKYRMQRLLSFTMGRLVSDMQKICEGGELTFSARKHKKDDPVGLVYEYYAKVVGVTGELLADISDVSQKIRDGDANKRLNEKKYKGPYYGAAQNVNNMLGSGNYMSRMNAL